MIGALQAAAAEIRRSQRHLFVFSSDNGYHMVSTYDARKDDGIRYRYPRTRLIVTDPRFRPD